MYKPPFVLTTKMLSLSLSIAQKIECLSLYQSLERIPVLRRNSRIQSIHSSLAIEAGPFSLDQIRDILNGNPALGPQKDIDEVKDAYQAYQAIETYDGFKEEDLCKAHGIIARSIDEEHGRYRSHPEGVVDERGNILHVAPPEQRVPLLMGELFAWLKSDNDTPLLIKSCVFHYEFVFIHPFGDGNGRTARLWQTVLLMKWNRLFEYVPIESRIYRCQKEYYAAIEQSHKNGDSTAFVEFVLQRIDEAIDETLNGARRESRNVSEQVNRLLDVMEPDVPLSANELMKRLGIKSKETLRGSYLNPAIDSGLVKRTLPDKPKSKNQKYYK